MNIIPGDQQWTQLQVHIGRDTSTGIVMMAMFDLIWSQQIVIFYSVICRTIFHSDPSLTKAILYWDCVQIEGEMEEIE